MAAAGPVAPVSPESPEVAGPPVAVASRRMPRARRRPVVAVGMASASPVSPVSPELPEVARPAKVAVEVAAPVLPVLVALAWVVASPEKPEKATGRW